MSKLDGVFFFFLALLFFVKQIMNCKNKNHQTCFERYHTKAFTNTYRGLVDAIQHLWSVEIAVAVWQTEVHTISSVWLIKKKKIQNNKIIAIYLFIYISLYSMCFLWAVHAAVTLLTDVILSRRTLDVATSYRQGRATNVNSSKSMCVPPLREELVGCGWKVGLHRWAYLQDFNDLNRDNH